MRRLWLVAAATMMFAAPAISEVTVTASERDARNAAVIRDAYPRQSLAVGEEGIVHYRIGLYDDGRIRSCVVTVASGYERLDTATCELLVSSRFKSVRDDGQRVRSSHDGTMAWVLPATRRKAVPPPRTQPAGKELAAAERICRSERAEGSLVRERTYCLSQAEWTRLERRGRDMLLNFTSEMGGAVF